VLGVSGMTAQQAVMWRVRRCLEQRLANSRCQVVVGVDLEEIDPVKQLAGLPSALQHALA
jgi:hypothetical protein